MGESKYNRTALVAKTMPTFPPHGRQVGLKTVQFVVEKPHVFIVAPGETPDPVDVATHAEQCKQVGLTQEMHTLGEPLAPEKCDVVFCYAVAYLDTIHRRAGMVRLPGEIMRVDMVSLLASGEASLGEQSRIVAPSGLAVVP